MGALNVPWLFAANAIAPALATDALKATDTFSPNIITIMPASRINVAACSGLSCLRWELLNTADAERAAWLPANSSFSSHLSTNEGRKWCLSPHTKVTGCTSSACGAVRNKPISYLSVIELKC